MGHVGILSWKAVDSLKTGIRRSMIAEPALFVLNILKRKGFEAYLVGGCVRDLLLKKTPKDFDVVTTANLREIKEEFHKCLIVGKRFPICHVHIKGSIIEVSSFETTHQHDKKKKETFSFSQIPTGCDNKDIIRWRNCMKRDFTINSLFYDPFVNKIYDYADGLQDIRMCKVRTLIPAHLSFTQDCARILRGLRIAARLGLIISKETATAIRDHSSSIAMLDKQRLGMEMNYMLAFGAAESSFRLLSEFNLLEILFPIHAAYLAQAKKLSTGCPNMLMHLFASMDKLLAADRSCDSSLWIGLLAFHMALINHPQDALLVLTFSSALYHGNWKKAVKFARQNAQMHIHFLPEISETIGTKSDDELLKEVSQFASLAKSSLNALVDKAALRKAMDRYPTSPFLGLVFISKVKGANTSKLFNVLEGDIKSYVNIRKNSEINYEFLSKGNISEVRFVLGKIVLDAMIGRVVPEQNQQAGKGSQDKGKHKQSVEDEHGEKSQPRVSVGEIGVAVVQEQDQQATKGKQNKEKHEQNVEVKHQEKSQSRVSIGERKNNGVVHEQSPQDTKGKWDKKKHGQYVEVEYKEKSQPQVSRGEKKKNGGGVVQEENQRATKGKQDKEKHKNNVDVEHKEKNQPRVSRGERKKKGDGIVQEQNQQAANGKQDKEKHEQNVEVEHKEKCQPQVSIGERKKNAGGVVQEENQQATKGKQDKEKHKKKVDVEHKEKNQPPVSRGERKKKGDGIVQEQNQQAAKGKQDKKNHEQNVEVEHKEKCQPQVSIGERKKNAGGVLQERSLDENYQSWLSTEEKNQEEKHPKNGDDCSSKKRKRKKDVGESQNVVDKEEKHQPLLLQEQNREIVHKEKRCQPLLSSLFRTRSH